ncbi:hypothetical protein R6Q57_015836 [Mikania cordata]
MNSQGATEFVPSFEWVNEDDCDTLLLYLPGFMKEQLRVQLRSRTLIISGQCKLQDNTLSVFRKEFPVAEHCVINKITAKFEGNILYVKQPKSNPPMAKQDEKDPMKSNSPMTKQEEKDPAKSSSPVTKQEEKDPENAPTQVPKKPIDEQKGHHEKTKRVSKPTSSTQQNGNSDVRNNVKDSPKKDLGENTSNEPKVHQEKAKNNAKDGPEKNAGEKDGELKETKGVCENASKKKLAGGLTLAMKMKPSRKTVVKVLVIVTGFVMVVYWTKMIQSWMA